MRAERRVVPARSSPVVFAVLSGPACSSRVVAKRRLRPVSFHGRGVHHGRFERDPCGVHCHPARCCGASRLPRAQAQCACGRFCRFHDCSERAVPFRAGDRHHLAYVARMPSCGLWHHLGRRHVDALLRASSAGGVVVLPVPFSCGKLCHRVFPRAHSGERDSSCRHPDASDLAFCLPARSIGT